LVIIGLTQPVRYLVLFGPLLKPMAGQLGAALSSVSYAVALNLKSEESLAPLLHGVSTPLLLSGILLPMSLARLWPQRVSDVNPPKHVADGTRAQFQGDLGSSAAP
jgi:ABC-2 type transport system permease protein